MGTDPYVIENNNLKNETHLGDICNCIFYRNCIVNLRNGKIVSAHASCNCNIKIHVEYTPQSNVVIVERDIYKNNDMKNTTKILC
jgi:hypothetical protein